MSSPRVAIVLVLCAGLVLGCAGPLKSPAEEGDQSPALSAANELPETYEFVLAWGETGDGPGQFRAVNTVAVAPDGTIYTGELGGLRIQRFTSMGEFLNMWGEPGEDPGQFVGIRGLTIAPWGDVYVSDSDTGTWDPSRVQQFTVDGEFIRSFWQHGPGPDDFDTNWGLEVEPDSLLYVTDLNRGVLVFTAEGRFQSHWLYEPPLVSPSDIAFAWDSALGMDVAYIQASGPMKYEPLGDLLIDGSEAGYSTRGIAAANEQVYICNRGGSMHVEKRNSQLELLAQFCPDGTGPGECTTSAGGIAVDDSGHVYIADAALNRIQKFRKKPETAILQTSWSKLKYSK